MPVCRLLAVATLLCLLPLRSFGQPFDPRMELTPPLVRLPSTAETTLTLPPIEQPLAEAPLLASAQPTPTEAAGPATNAAAAAPTEAQQIGALQKSLGEVAKNLTVVSADPEVKLVLGGAVVADFLFNSARPVAPGIPFYLAPGPANGFEQDTFDGTARQSSLYALFAGPKVGDFETGGFIFANLYNASLIEDLYGVLPIQAFAQLKSDQWRFAAGLQLDIFNPVNPTMLPFSLLVGSGNCGLFREQIRAERFLYPTDDDSLLKIAMGLSEPVPTTVNDDFRINEDNGWPNIEGRISWATGDTLGEGFEERKALEMGVSGVVGQMRTTTPLVTQVVGDVWGLGYDVRYEFCCRAGIKGEAYTGQGLGTYGGAILQDINNVTYDTIRSSGAWGEAWYYFIPGTLHSHVGYGVDNPDTADLSNGQVSFNETYYANLIWDYTKQLRFGLEFTWRKTDYVVLNENDGFGLHFQTMYKF